MTQKEELKQRFEAESKRLEARIAELKADAEQKKNEASETIQNTADQLREKLSQLKAAVAGGWDALTEEGAKRINTLLDATTSADDQPKSES